jgi:hypothetical protein
VGLACLDLSRGALALEHSSAAWTVSVARAESALAAAESGVSLPTELDESLRQTVDGRRAPIAAPAQVTVRPFRDNLDVIVVVVPMPNGNEFTMQRVVRRRGAAPRVAAATGMPAPSVTR